MLKMQSLMELNSIEKDHIRNKHKWQLGRKMHPVIRNVLHVDANSKEQLESYFNKLAIDIIIHNSLGEPSKVAVMQDTLNALKSVMPKNDLIEFLALPEMEKLESLTILRDIVCGIRVFNKDSGYCGEGVLDSMCKCVIRRPRMTTDMLLFQWTKSCSRVVQLLVRV